VLVKAVLADNGRSSAAGPSPHPYDLLLGLEDIKHRNTRVATPFTNASRPSRQRSITRRNEGSDRQHHRLNLPRATGTRLSATDSIGAPCSRSSDCLLSD
jgi:hypothetical protein